MDTTKDLIYKSAKTLADHWEGDACEKAPQGMQKLWESADQIYSTSKDTGIALTGQAATLRKYRVQAGEEGGLNSKMVGLTGAATILIPGMAGPVSFARRTTSTTAMMPRRNASVPLGSPKTRTWGATTATSGRR